MVTVPAATPVTTPVAEPTIALDVLLLTHVPPDSAFVSVAEAPMHTVDGPEIVPGEVDTVTTVAVEQPVSVYVIPAVPAATVVSTPEAEPTEATDIFPLDHVPPEGMPESAEVPPAHTVPAPLIAVGEAFTVT